MSTPEELRSQFNTFTAGFSKISTNPSGKPSNLQNSIPPPLSSSIPPPIGSTIPPPLSSKISGGIPPPLRNVSTFNIPVPAKPSTNKSSDTLNEFATLDGTSGAKILTKNRSMSLSGSSFPQISSNPAPSLITPPSIQQKPSIPSPFQVTNQSSSILKPQGLVDVPVSEDISFDICFSIPDRTKYHNTVTVQGSISEAISQAPEKSKIIVPAGTYHETLIIEKSVQIISNGKVIIASNGSQECAIIKAPDVIMSGLELIQKDSQGSGALLILSGVCLLEDCILSSQSMPTVSLKNDSSSQFTKCKITGGNCPIIMANNNADAVFIQTTISNTNGNGVVLRGDSRAKFVESSINSITKSGIIAADSTSLLVQQSRFSACDVSAIEISSTNPNIFVCDSTIESCSGSGIVSYLKSSPKITNNILKDCTGPLIECSEGTNLQMSKNKLSGNSNPSQLYGGNNTTIISNDDSFTGTSFTSIGVNGDMKLNLHKTKIENISGAGIVAFGENCIVSLNECSIAKTTLSSIMIHGMAKITINASTICESDQHGIHLNEASGSSISNTSVYQCKLCGVELTKSSSIIVQNCKFAKNDQLGMFANESVGSITDCDFSENNVGGALFNISQFEITNPSIEKNNGPGLILHDSSKISIQSGKSKDNLKANIQTDTKSELSCRSHEFYNSKGLSIAGNSSSITKLISCRFEKHPVTAVQISDENTKAVISESKFIENCVGINVSNADLTISNSYFSKNGIHIDASNRTVAQINEIQFLDSTGGAGCHIHSDSKVTFQNCTFTNNANAAIANAAYAKIINTIISGSSTTGIYEYGLSTGEISSCTFSKNGSCGIQIISGSPSIVDNKIEFHSDCGIHIASSATPQIGGNTFISNGNVNVNRE